MVQVEAAKADIPHARWLPWAQVAVWIHAALSLLLFAVGTPIFFSILTTPCAQDCSYFLQLQPVEVNALSQIGWTLERYALFQLSLEFMYLVIFSVIGGALYVKLVWRHDPQAWYGLLATFALLSLGTILLAETSMSVRTAGPGWHALYDFLKASSYVAFLTFCLLFPDGRFVPNWVRWSLIPLLLWMAIWMLTPLPNLDPAEAVGIQISLLMLALIVGTQVYRYRRVSTSIQRQQTKWFVFGFGIVFAAVFLWMIISVALPFPPGPERVLSNLVGQGFLSLFPVAFVVCIAISLLRYRLWEIDILINRTLVYGALTVIVAAIYVVIVAGSGRLFHNENNLIASLAATGVIAVIFHPLRSRLQLNVNRWLYGERDDPAGVLTRLTSQLETTGSSGSLLAVLVETIASSLKLPYVALWLYAEDGALTLVTQTGVQRSEVETLPLLHQQESVGQLQVAPRAPGEALSAEDRQLLAAIARLTAATARTIQLTDQVQEARVRTVSAREEERRRLRRDLHDGLGPVLASQGLKLAAARQLLREKPEVAERLLDEVMSQSENTVAEIRRLVYALRPPTLDELGLVEAIREHVQVVGTNAGVQIVVDAPAVLPEIPAAVEVAAFRIVQEALNNVIRHAGARHCAISIASDGGLHIRIEDDGVGLPAQTRSGVGLQSMRERAAEVGGVCTIENGEERGVVVGLSLPIQVT
jgi:signal transduction histidine kinase